MDLETLLTELGLNQAEAKTYRALANFNELSASELAEKSGLKRTLAYHTAARLVELGLAVEFEKNKIKYYQATNPDNITGLFQNYHQKTNRLAQALENILPTLNKKYTSRGERPFVDIYTGLNGLETIQKTFLREAENGEVLIFASPFLRKDKKIDELIRKHVRLEEQKGIGVRALVKEAEEELTAHPEIRLESKNIRVRVIPAEEFQLPGQVFVWGNTVAFNTVGEEMISTIVRNKAIAETFRLIFNALWNRTNPPAELM